MKVIENYDGKKVKPLMFANYEVDRFWNSIALKARTDLCWNWQRVKNRDGYGLFRTTGGSRKKKHFFIASRVSYFLYYKTDPSEKRVLHSCDNPTCCNPNHLFLGTHQDNIDDMMKKGRKANRVGEKNTQAKLTETDVIEIRSKFEKGLSKQELASAYNTSKDNIRCIVKRINWKHI